MLRDDKKLYSLVPIFNTMFTGNILNTYLFFCLLLSSSRRASTYRALFILVQAGKGPVFLCALTTLVRDVFLPFHRLQNFKTFHTGP